jgi:WD40 repeat protein
MPCYAPHLVQAVRVWDVHTGRLRMSLTGHSGKVTGVDCSPADAQVAVTCAADRTIKASKPPPLLLLLLPGGTMPGSGWVSRTTAAAWPVDWVRKATKERVGSRPSQLCQASSS